MLVLLVEVLLAQSILVVVAENLGIMEVEMRNVCRQF